MILDYVCLKEHNTHLLLFVKTSVYNIILTILKHLFLSIFMNFSIAWEH